MLNTTQVLFSISITQDPRQAMIPPTMSGPSHILWHNQIISHRLEKKPVTQMILELTVNTITMFKSAFYFNFQSICSHAYAHLSRMLAFEFIID